MRLKLMIGILLFLQAVLLIHMVSLLSDDLTGLQVAAQGGTVTHVDLSGTTVWGGMYGSLTGDGSEQLVVRDFDVLHSDVRYNDSDNECRRTELFASSGGVAAADIDPIAPSDADTILGFDPDTGFSVSAMFDEQFTYDLAGQAVTLWSTRTNGQLTEFIQGVGQANGQVVFVTRTGRNTQAYNGEPAGYQFILPAGTWGISHDATDTCVILDNYTQPQEPSTTQHLDVAIPDRVCVMRDNTFFAVETQDRTFCGVDDVGKWWCEPLSGIDVTVRADGTDALTTASAENGSFTFAPQISAQHTVRLTDGNRSVQRSFTSQACLDHTDGTTSEDRTIQLQAPSIEFGDVFGQEPQTESPAVQVAKVEFTLISILAAVIVALSAIAYYETHKDTVAFLLKARIWLLERLR